jgi:hypothetical protein
MNRSSTPWLICTLLLAATGRGADAGTNAPSLDPASFARFISERNIFDPDRRARVPGETRRPVERPKGTVTPTLTLVGTMDYSRGRFAFFDGPAPEYRKTVGVDGNIAGYTLSQVRPSSVLLHPKEGADVELKLGTPLRLDGAPPVDGPSTTATESDKPADSGTPAASGDAAEILRKLMQKREQESK